MFQVIVCCHFLPYTNYRHFVNPHQNQKTQDTQQILCSPLLTEQHPLNYILLCRCTGFSLLVGTIIVLVTAFHSSLFKLSEQLSLSFKNILCTSHTILTHSLHLIKPCLPVFTSLFHFMSISALRSERFKVQGKVRPLRQCLSLNICDN